MPLPTKSIEPAHESGGTSEQTGPPSNNLWIGNLSSDVTQSDLMDLFAQYGALDSVASYSARSYGFVFFKRIEDAKAAKDALQGTLLRGSSINIEFARPAKPCKHLWVGGISPAITKEDLEAEFRKFGKIEYFKFLRDNNTACVEYFDLDDATQAVKIMNGKCIGGDHIRVDFLRSQSSKKGLLLDYGQFLGKSMGPTDFYTGQRRPQHLQPSVGRKGDGLPSNILWIGYPPSVQIDEKMLHNAMILFGEIERIKSFPSRQYSFVEFRSMDEAQRAKEGLQGRLFNDPRIMIMYSSIELAPGKDYPGFYPGSTGPRSDMFLNEHPFRPLQVDVFGHNRPMVPNNFPGQLPPGGIIGPTVLMRPFGPQGSHEPLISSPEFNDLGAHHKYQDGSSESQTVPNWKRPSSSPPSPPSESATRPTTRSSTGVWDVFDINQFQRYTKHSRIDGALPADNAPFPFRNFDACGLGLGHSYGIDPIIDGGGSGPYVNFKGKTHLGAEDSRSTAGVPGPVQSDDHIWRGIIAKGGTPVCNARCLPVGKEIGNEFPEVVDCSARTGLDILTKHYADAIGFETVFFLPDSEEDFASYTEFLRYLISKNRAGVAKFVDGTTLFLVPPSDFLTKVLKVTGPDRLYGVVLKFPRVPSRSTMQQSSHLPIHYTDRQHIPSLQPEYGLIPAKEEQVLPMDYGRFLQKESKIPPKPLYPATSAPHSSQSVDPASSSNASASLAGVTLTPELIATLASLLPTATQSSATDGTKSTVGPLTVEAPFPTVALSDGNQSYLWKQDHKIAELSSHPSQQLGYQPYPPASAPGHPAQMVSGSSHIQDSAASEQQQGAVSCRPITNFMIPSRSGQIAGSPQVRQHYQVEVSPSSHKGYGVMQGSDTSALYSSQTFQQPNNSITSYNEAYDVNPSQQHTVIPYTVDRVNVEIQNGQVQSALSGAGQGTSEVDADKKRRYQSATDGTKSAVGSLTVKAPFPTVALSDGNQSYLWKRDHKIAEPSSHPSQQLGYQPYPPASAPGHPAQMVSGSSHIQVSAASEQQQGAVSCRPITNFMIPSRSGQIAGCPQVRQHYQVEVSPSSHKGYGEMQGPDTSGLYSSQTFQQPNNSITSYNEAYDVNPSQQRTVIPYTADRVNVEIQNEQVQSALFGTGQGISEVDADKKQRYQSTLQFAASLLFQIQQQQQKTQGGCGPGNQ